MFINKRWVTVVKTYDLLIQNGTVIDGTGAPRYQADLAIIGDRIAAIGKLSAADAAKTIDATGRIVCPGFIDAHGHSDFTLFVNNRGESKIRQGITTEVTGNCGFTAGPFTEDHRDDLFAYLSNTIVLTGEKKDAWRWESQNAFLEHSAANGLSFNIVPLVGQGMIHVGVMGFADREPTEEELQRMGAMLRKELDAGFFGMSMAYAYEPAESISPKENALLLSILKDYGGVYAIHLKDQQDKVLESVSDAIDFARQTGVSVQVSHLKAKYAANFGKAGQAADLISQAKADGLDVAWDVYPYIAYGGGLIDIIPPWAKKDGAHVMCQKLQDPQLRVKALRDMEFGIDGWETILNSPGWADCVQIATLKTDKNRHLEGKFVSEIATLWGCTPYEAVVDLMVQENASVKCVWFAMDEQELIHLMQRPDAMFGTDGRACATYGELSGGMVHPRYYSTYPRILGHYARDLGIFSLEDAIYKSTASPALRFGIAGRGILQADNFADIVIFDPDTIREVGIFGDPHHYPEGIDAVIVNGQIVIDQGEHTGNLPGKILRKFQK